MRHRHGDKITLGKLKEIVKEKEEKGAASTSTRDPHHHHVAGTSTLGGASSSPALTTSTSREKPGGDGDTLQNDDALPLPLPLPLLTQTPLAQSPPYTIPTFSIHEFRTSARYNFSKGGMLEQVEGVTVLDGGILFADEVADSRSQEAVYRIIDASRVIDGSGAASAEHCQLDERTDAPHSRADFAHVSSASEFDLRYLHPPLLYLMSFYFPSLPPLIFLLRSFLLDPLPSFPSMLLNGLLCIFRLPTILVSLYFAHLAYGGTTLYAKYAWCVMPLLPVLWYHSPPEPAWYGRLASARVLWLWMARMGTKIAAAKEAHKMRLLDPEGELRVAQVRAHEAEVALAASNSRSGNATTTSLTTPPASSALMGRKYYYTNHHVRTNRFRICITSLAPGTITLSYTLPQSLVVSLCTQSQNAAASRRNSTSGTTSIAPSDVRVLIDDTLHHDVSVSMPKGVIVLTKVTGGSRKIKVGIKGYWSCETVVDVTAPALPIPPTPPNTPTHFTSRLSDTLKITSLTAADTEIDELHNRRRILQSTLRRLQATHKKAVSTLRTNLTLVARSLRQDTQVHEKLLHLIKATQTDLSNIQTRITHIVADADSLRAELALIPDLAGDISKYKSLLKGIMRDRKLKTELKQRVRELERKVAEIEDEICNISSEVTFWSKSIAEGSNRKPIAEGEAYGVLDFQHPYVESVYGDELVNAAQYPEEVIPHRGETLDRNRKLASQPNWTWDANSPGNPYSFYTSTMFENGDRDYGARGGTARSSVASSTTMNGYAEHGENVLRHLGVD